MQQTYREHVVYYPKSWEKEYRDNLTVADWTTEFPNLFYSGVGFSTRPGTLDLFAQHALMYILRKSLGFMSVTWYYLAEMNKNSKNRDRTLAAWDSMRLAMGDVHFETLQTALLEAGLTGFKGEPDLFCWHPDTGDWLFAEAKRKDKLIESQLRWFDICHETLGDASDIRVYTLTPDNTTAKQ